MRAPFRHRIPWLTLAHLTMSGALWFLLYPLFPVSIPPEEELIPVVNREGKWGHITGRGRQVGDFQWDHADFYHSDGWAQVRKGDHIGWIDRRGKIVVPMQWVSPHQSSRVFFDVRNRRFDSGNRAVFFKDSKLGWLDRRGQEVLPFVWEDAAAFDDHGTAQVKKDGKWGCINREGKLIVPLEWEYMDEFDSEGMARVGKNGKWGWINREGKIVVPVQMDLAFPFGPGGLAMVKQGSHKAGAINREGKLVVPMAWEYGGYFDAMGMAVVKEANGKCGWINREGKIVIPVEWDQLEDFMDFDDQDMVMVRKDGKLGWINRKGEIAIPLRFDWAFRFDKFGEAWVEEGGRLARINRKGDRVKDLGLTPMIANSTDFSSGLLDMDNQPIELKAGCMDRNGKWVIPVGDWVSVSFANEDLGGTSSPFIPVLVNGKELPVMAKAWDWLASKVTFLKASAVPMKDVHYCAVYHTPTGRVVWTSDDRGREIWWGTGLAAGAAWALFMARRRWRERKRELA